MSKKETASTRKRFEELQQEEKDFIHHLLKDRFFYMLLKYQNQKKLNKPQLNTIIDYAELKIKENNIELHKKEIIKYFYYQKSKLLKEFKKNHPEKMRIKGDK